LRKLILFIFILFFTIQVSAYTVSIVDMQIEAEVYLNQNEIFKSISLFREIIARNPSYFETRLSISKAYFLLGEYNEALLHIQEAMRLNGSSMDAKILSARILTGQGSFSEARSTIDFILEEQENNIEAILSLAELEVAEGNILIAIELYNSALLKVPDNRKALISSIILFDSLKKNNISNTYVEQILLLYPEDAYVNFIASKHYFEIDDLKTSLIYGNRSYNIDPENSETIYLLSLLYTTNYEYELAVQLLEKSIKISRSDSFVWYLLGEIYLKLENVEKSVYSFGTALSYSPQSEISRIALENILLKYYSIDDPLRVKYADYHFNLANDLLEKNLASQARDEIRRGLLLYPHSINGQKLYADIMKTRGFLNNYFSVISRLSEDIPEDIDLADEVEIYSSIILDTVSEKWEMDQFFIESPRYNIDIFLNQSSIPLNPFNEGIHLGNYLVHILQGYEKINAEFHGFPSDYSRSFNISRSAKSDYFMIFTFKDTERSIWIEAEIFHSGTGSLLQTIPILKTGNQKVYLSLKNLSGILFHNLQTWGKIIDRKFNQILLDIGKMQGVEVEDTFYVIRDTDLEIKKDSIGLNFDPSSILGEVSITKTDDLVSEGILKKYNFFDLINSGDLLIKRTEEMTFPEDPQLRVQKDLPADLYKAIIGTR
jgi:tetratricopeptide (TPR) repeat protein